MKFMVFDCETTGLPDFKKPADDPCQPRMIQLAAYLFDGNPEPVDGFVRVVKPDGWKMDDALAEKLGHGLTHDHLEKNGLPVRDVLDAFCPLHDQADMLVAYGVDFDLKILRGELRRAGLADRYGEKPKFCVMRNVTALCKIPPTHAMMASGRRSFKTPKLGEAVEILLKEKLVNAHDACADCTATARLLFHLIELGKGPRTDAPLPPKKPAPAVSSAAASAEPDIF